MKFVGDNLNMNGNSVLNASNLVTKQELYETLTGSSVSPVASVILASTEHIDIQNPDSIDSNYFKNGRVLLKDQLDPEENGIYEWVEPNKLVPVEFMDENAYVFVTGGLFNKDTGWMVSNGQFIQYCGSGQVATTGVISTGTWSGNGLQLSSSGSIHLSDPLVLQSNLKPLEDKLTEAEAKISKLTNDLVLLTSRLAILETRNHKLENVYKNWC